MKLEHPRCVVDPIARFLGFGINVRKPAYTTCWHIFEVLTMFVEQVIVVLKAILS
jgi:hypothetical protein